MTDILDPTLPPPPDGDRTEPVDIQQEMQRSYIDYAMSVIVGRALPLVEDGLKPVHRRVLYSMGENGFRPDRSYVKCARVVGEVMGNYHPHGDSPIYDALVRLAQPWALRYPLIDGQGNFGSRGNDPAAAMRYCVTGDTQVALPDGSVAIADLAPGIRSDSTMPVDIKVIGLHGTPVRVTAVHHSGTHPVLRVHAGNRSIRCTREPPPSRPRARGRLDPAALEAGRGARAGRHGRRLGTVRRLWRGSRTRNGDHWPGRPRQGRSRCAAGRVLRLVTCSVDRPH